MSGDEPLVDYPGIYGGPMSRDEIVRALKEALALVEYTARDAELSCSGLRIQVLYAGAEGDEEIWPRRR